MLPLLIPLLIVGFVLYKLSSGIYGGYDPKNPHITSLYLDAHGAPIDSADGRIEYLQIPSNIVLVTTRHNVFMFQDEDEKEIIYNSTGFEGLHKLNKYLSNNESENEYYVSSGNLPGFNKIPNQKYTKTYEDGDVTYIGYIADLPYRTSASYTGLAALRAAKREYPREPSRALQKVTGDNRDRVFKVTGDKRYRTSVVRLNDKPSKHNSLVIKTLYGVLNYLTDTYPKNFVIMIIGSCRHTDGIDTYNPYTIPLNEYLKQHAHEDFSEFKRNQGQRPINQVMVTDPPPLGFAARICDCKGDTVLIKRRGLHELNVIIDRLSKLFKFMNASQYSDNYPDKFVKHRKYMFMTADGRARLPPVYITPKSNVVRFFDTDVMFDYDIKQAGKHVKHQPDIYVLEDVELPGISSIPVTKITELNLVIYILDTDESFNIRIGTRDDFIRFRSSAMLYGVPRVVYFPTPSILDDNYISLRGDSIFVEEARQIEDEVSINYTVGEYVPIKDMFNPGDTIDVYAFRSDSSAYGYTMDIKNKRPVSILKELIEAHYETYDYIAFDTTSTYGFVAIELKYLKSLFPPIDQEFIDVLTRLQTPQPTEPPQTQMGST